ncbi:MAG TPA: hypothetical protein VFJ87_04910 [Rhodanobacteraceae bacterium]|nr:hypothetical protein [Rhodanobacteraceae bacterium]
MSTTTAQDEAAHTFIEGIGKIHCIFQQSSAQVQALEILTLCMFAMHPNPQGVRRLFEEASKRACAVSERDTLPKTPAFHAAFCQHLQRLAGTMPERAPAPGIH